MPNAALKGLKRVNYFYGKMERENLVWCVRL